MPFHSDFPRAGAYSGVVLVELCSRAKGISCLAFLVLILITGKSSGQYAVSLNGTFAPQFDSPNDIAIGPNEFSGPYDIGFDFEFFGNPYGEFYVSSNGFISFNSSAFSGPVAQQIPDPDYPNSLIGAGWGGLAGDGIYISFETMGLPGSRTLHVNFYIQAYENFPECPSEYFLESQIILYETSNIIEIHTLNWDGFPCQVYATQGIENEEGTEAFTSPGRNNSLWGAYNDFVAFIPESYIDIAVLSHEPVVCEGLQDIKILIQNLSGRVVDSTYFAWEWEGVPQDSVFINTPISPNALVQITLGQKSIMATTNYTLSAWSYTPQNGSDDFTGNDTIGGPVSTGLSGIFTIGGAAPDYATISAAIVDLTTYGVCDSVIFDIRPGTYAEELDFNFFHTTPGAYAVFRSESGNAQDVIISKTYSMAGANRLVELQNVLDLQFRNLTFKVLGSACSIVIYLNSFCADIILSHCVFRGSPCNVTNATGAVISMVNGGKSQIVLRHNTIRKGSYGVFVSPGVSSYVNDLTLLENSIDSASKYGVYLNRINNLVFDQNEIFSPSSGVVGLELNQIYGDATVSNNAVHVPLGWYGVRLFGYNYNFSFGEDTLYVFNNMINLGGTISSSRAFSIDYSDEVRLWHNTFNSYNSHSTSLAFFEGSNTNIQLRNTIISNLGTGKAASLDSVNADFNAYFATNPPLIFRGVNYSTLEDWQTASGMDLNSIEVNPDYQSADDLHLTGSVLNNSGSSLSPPVMTDIDGDNRSLATPDIGADEFGPTLPNWPGGTIVYLDQDAAGLNDGTSWADAFTELKDAIYVAGRYENVQEIWVAEGIYSPHPTRRDTSFILHDSIRIYGGFIGVELTRGERTANAELVQISGDINQTDTLWDNSFHTVVLATTCQACVIDGVTITYGHADDTNNANDIGAGVLNQGVGHFYNVVFERNYATDHGAALHSSGAGANLIIEDCIFRLNTSSLGRDVVNLAGAQVEFRGANGIH